MGSLRSREGVVHPIMPVVARPIIGSGVHHSEGTQHTVCAELGWPASYLKRIWWARGSATKIFSDNGVSVTAMCVGSHQYGRAKQCCIVQRWVR